MMMDFFPSCSFFPNFQYILYALVCFLGFAAAGILGALTSQDWFSLIDSPLFLFGQVDVENLRNSVTATSVSSFIDSTTFFG